MPSSRRFGSIMIIRTSSGVARYRMLVSMPLMPTDLPAPVEPAISRCGIVREVEEVRLAVNRLAERQRQLGGRAPVGFRLQQLAQRNLFAGAVGNLDADGRLAGNAVDQDRLGLHRQTQVVGEAGDLRVLHAGVGLELERGHDRPGMDLRDRPLDRELAAFLFQQARAVHQLALVDLALGLGRVEQRQRRQGIVALAPLGRRFGHRLRVGQRQRRGRHGDLRRLRRRERFEAAEERRLRRCALLVVVLSLAARFGSRHLGRLDRA